MYDHGAQTHDCFQCAYMAECVLPYFVALRVFSLCELTEIHAEHAIDQRWGDLTHQRCSRQLQDRACPANTHRPDRQPKDEGRLSSSSAGVVDVLYRVASLQLHTIMTINLMLPSLYVQ